jgi:hypothetical protein
MSVKTMEKRSRYQQVSSKDENVVTLTDAQLKNAPIVTTTFFTEDIFAFKA